MSNSIRRRLLEAIAQRGPIDDSIELVLDAGTDQHNLIHVLYSLNRVGLIKMRLKKSGRQQLVQKITITPLGERELARLRGS